MLGGVEDCGWGSAGDVFFCFFFWGGVATVAGGAFGGGGGSTVAGGTLVCCWQMVAVWLCWITVTLLPMKSKPAVTVWSRSRGAA